jgi:hypothetical protein
MSLGSFLPQRKPPPGGFFVPDQLPVWATRAVSGE